MVDRDMAEATFKTMSSYTRVLVIAAALSTAVTALAAPLLGANGLPSWAVQTTLLASAFFCLGLLVPGLLPMAPQLKSWWQLHCHGPAELSQMLLQQSSNKVVTVNTAHCGRITYIGRADVAEEVFDSPAFVNRLGSDYGLKLLGMHKQGIIWNNDADGWKAKRSFFTKGIQGLIGTHEQHVKQVCIAAFKLTLLEQCYLATAAIRSSTGTMPEALPAISELAGLPLSQLAFKVAGLDLDLLPDGRDFLRLITFRVTMALALGLPVDTLNRSEALDVVYKVAAYFKAWEHFLLRPAWLGCLTSRTAKHQQHLEAIKALQSATTTLIKQAAAYSKEIAKATPQATTNSSLPFESSFLGKLLSAQASGQLSRNEVQQLVLEMLLAGTDTSSVSLYYLMVELQGNRTLEYELRDEVLAAAGDITGLTDSQLAQQLHITAGYDPSLPKCQAATCEAMRYKPVGPVVIRQAVQPATIEYAAADADGQQQQVLIKPGDTVVISLATMHKDPKVFPAPQRFCPFGNFSKPGSSCSGSGVDAVTATVTGSGAGKVFRPFGHGRKGCVGRELGWLEMKMILVCWQLTMRFRAPPAGDAGAGGMAPAVAAAGCLTTRGDGATERHRRSLLDLMTTKWEVASQPTNPIPLHLRCVHPAGPSLAGTVRKVYVVGPHGSGKTTLCRALMEHLSPGSSFAANVTIPAVSAYAGRPETYRTTASGVAAVTAPAGMEVSEVCLPTDKATSVDATVSVVTMTADTTTASSGSPGPSFILITETARTVMGEEGITRNMLAQPSVFLHLQHRITERQLQLETSMGPGCFISDRCVIDAVAYTADRFGYNSQEVTDLLALPSAQELLYRCRAEGSLVLLLPPFQEGLPEDDGTRSMSDTARLTAAFEVVVQQQAVPYEFITAVDRCERVKEVLQLLGMGYLYL